MVPPIVSWKIDVAIRAMHFFRNPESQVILAVVDTSGRVRLYHPERGAEVRRNGKPVGFDVPAWAPVHDITHLRRPTGWPDLVAVGGDGTTRVFDLSTGRKRFERTLPEPEELRVGDTLSAPDGSAVIAVAGRGNLVHLWRRGVAEPERLGGHTGPVRVLNALRVERHIAVADELGVTVWRVSGPRAERRYSCPGRSRALAVLREHDGVRLVSATADGLHLWDTSNGAHLAHFAQAHSVASVVSFDAEHGEQMLAVASDRTVTLWSPATEEPSKTQLSGVPDGTLKVLTRILTGNGTLLAAGDERGNITVWRLVPQRRTANMVGSHDDWVNQLAVVRLASEQPLLASASDDRSIRLWDITTSRPRGDPIRFQPEAQIQAVVAVGRDLAIGDQLGYVRRWATDRGTMQWERHTKYGPVRAMASFLTDDGWRIVSAGAAGHCLVWDAEAGEVVHVLRPRWPAVPLDPAAAPVRAVAAAKVGDQWLIAAGDLDGNLEVWDAATGKPRWERFEAHPNAQVRSLACVPTRDRVLLASGSSAGTIRLWDLASRTDAGLVTAHGGPVSALFPVRDGRTWLLASGGADRDIRLWDPAEFGSELSAVINAHESWVRALVYVPPSEPAQTPGDGETQLASGGEEGSIRLWQVRDRQLVRSTYQPIIRGFRDRVATVDLLNREAVTAELLALLCPNPAGNASAAPGTEPTNGPQVILIHGAWGTGKSSLMRNLRDRLEQTGDQAKPAQLERLSPGARVTALARRIRTWRQERELSPHAVNRIASRGARSDTPKQPVQSTVTAWFNPWIHQSSEQVWSGLAWTIVEETRDRLGASRAQRQRYWLGRNLHRLDRGALRRTIRYRIWRPFLVTVAALVAPLALVLVRIGGVGVDDDRLPSLRDFLNLLLGQEVQFPGAAEPGPLGLALADLLALALGVVLAVVVVVLGSYSVWQYYFGRATAHLPADVFDGPIDQAAVATATGERLLRTPPYISTAGRLYGINRDIEQLIDDLDTRGYQVVVFIDDLDRCPAHSTVEVFEAINAFLSDQTFPDSAPRFVIGMDSTVVANRLAAGYPDIAEAASASDPDDPNFGWGILRKLSQLAVVLPAIHLTHSARLLRQHSGAPTAAEAPPIPESPTGNNPAPNAGAPVPPGNTVGPHPTDAAVTVPTVAGNGPQYLALEGEPAVQAHLRSLTALRKQQNMRETKRLLTLWGFYVRLLTRLQPPGAMANVQDACDAMTLAEIVRRWPALVPALGRTGDGPSGLALLIRAATNEANDAGTRAWWTALRQLGLHNNRYAPAVNNLHDLLRRHGTDTLARFADLLL